MGFPILTSSKQENTAKSVYSTIGNTGRFLLPESQLAEIDAETKIDVETFYIGQAEPFHHPVSTQHEKGIPHVESHRRLVVLGEGERGSCFKFLCFKAKRSSHLVVAHDLCS